MEPKKEFQDDVLTKTIMLDNLLEWVFRRYFRIEPEYDSNGTMINNNKIEKFGRHFMENMGAHTKLELTKEILSEKYNVKKFPLDFDNKFTQLYKIRNIFAHSLYPKKVNQKEISFPYPGQSSWQELHDNHQKFYGEIIEFIGVNTAEIKID